MAYNFEPNYTALKFGVEIEMVVPHGMSLSTAQQHISAKLTEAGIANTIGWYTTTGAWGIKYDTSVAGNGSRGVEIVSPILWGTAGIEEMRRVMGLCVAAGFTVNHTCGLHVHHDAGGIRFEGFRYIVANYVKFEGMLDAVCGRGNGTYINSVRGEVTEVKARLEKVKSATAITELKRIYASTRYYKLNLDSLSAHGTVEFRHMEGTLNADLAAAWVKYTFGMMTAARDYEAGNLKSSCYIARGIDSAKNALVWLPKTEKADRKVLLDRINGVPLAAPAVEEVVAPNRVEVNADEFESDLAALRGLIADLV